MVPSVFKRLIGFVLLAMFGYMAVSQVSRSPRKVVQIAGVVMDNENLQPIPYVNISVKGTYRGAAADVNGFFSFVTYAGDSLVFSSIGFRTVTVKVPDTIETDRYTIYQSLMRDTFELPVTVIYPWPSKEKFREAFLNLDVPDDDFEIARKNVLLSELKERAKHSKMDAGMNYKHLTQQRADRLYYAGQQMPNNLLNPFAWQQFLRIWNQQKDEKKRQKAREWDSYEP
ncbi:MAG: carboxypeptidase-like regulatory domain-containing protein [Bacteroidales bacterium]|nr:carboxypeptidase-like regulatory domain-containing protein [Bacteroidales bacterium]